MVSAARSAFGHSSSPSTPARRARFKLPAFRIIWNVVFLTTLPHGGGMRIPLFTDAKSGQVRMALNNKHRLGCGNEAATEHPTSDIQYRMPSFEAIIGCWMSDVGCWMFPRFMERLASGGLSENCLLPE